MKLKFLFLSLIFLISFFTLRSQTQESDTVWVKTYTWDSLASYGTFSPTNDSIILMSARKIQIRATKDGELIREYPPVFPEELRIFDFAYSPDGKYVCYGGEAKYIILLNLETGVNTTITAVDSFTNGWVQSLCFSPDSKTLALSTDNYYLGNYIGQKFEFWDVETATLKFSHQTNENLQPLKYSPNGQLLIAGISGIKNSIINVFTGDSCKFLYAIEDNSGNDFTEFCISNDNSFVASCSFEGNLKIWDLNEKKITNKIEQGQVGTIIIKITNDNKFLVIGGGIDCKTKLLNFQTGKFIYNYSTNSVYGLDISSDSNYILSCNGDLVLYRFPYINEIEEIESIAVSNIIAPNPTNGTVSINLSGFRSNNINIKIYNSSGELVFNENVINNPDFYTLQTESMADGTYYCTIETEKETKTYKIIINK